ncbi:MAG: acetyl-CoA carboxylase biotin carboxyl carrier protein subunit [Bacteroidia bacterium]|nr:acetyl-CoA carboxylase biotin carboxyl carrier protein subunit [Bacteroidia bacterium]
MIYKATVNGKEFKVEKLKSSGQWRLNDEEIKPEIIQFKEGSFHAIINHKNYSVEIIDSDTVAKTVTLAVNGKEYTVQLKDQYDDLLHRLGMDAAGTHKANDLKAPMPGMVVNILVKEGQQINPGDALLTLEAMKMENVLKATGTGTVASVKVKPKQAVEKNEILIQFQ